MFGSLSEGAGEIKDVFDSGWVGEAVAGGWDLWKAIWSLNVKEEGVVLYG